MNTENYERTELVITEFVVEDVLSASILQYNRYEWHVIQADVIH